jgi:hypothetical protein
VYLYEESGRSCQGRLAAHRGTDAPPEKPKGTGMTACANAFIENNSALFLECYLKRQGLGAIMRQIIYCVLLIAIWLCSTASAICVLNFGGLGLVLIAGACFASFVSSVALAEEFVEWRRHTEASPVKRQLLPRLLKGSSFGRWTIFSSG